MNFLKLKPKIILITVGHLQIKREILLFAIKPNLLHKLRNSLTDLIKSESASKELTVYFEQQQR
jgi:hypothetical protein